MSLLYADILLIKMFMFRETNRHDEAIYANAENKILA